LDRGKHSPRKNRKVDVVVFANRRWEALPLVQVLTNPDAVPAAIVPHQTSPPTVPGLRTRVRIGRQTVELWCLEDLIAPGRNKSSTYEKAKALAKWRVRTALTIAFGTGASPRAQTNGDTIVGSSVFVHQANVAQPTTEHTDETWTHEALDSVVTSSANHILSELDANSLSEAAKRFVRPPTGAADRPAVRAGVDLIALSVVNVSDRSNYAAADQQAIGRFTQTGGDVESIGSIETTHGLLRLLLGESFLYVTGVANQVGKYESEVLGQSYAQNLAASHNAAVTLAWILPTLFQR
jgi:hypothetical protein